MTRGCRRSAVRRLIQFCRWRAYARTFACFAAVFLPAGLAAQPAPGYEAALDNVFAGLEESATPFSGLMVVGDADGRLYEHLSGYANFEHRVPIDRDTRFRIASLSKQFAGLLAVMLDDEGVVSLDEPLATYFPSLRGTPAGASTLELLLAHRSGLSVEDGYVWQHVISEYPWNWRTNTASSTFSPDTFLVRMAGATQATEPDSAYRYCNECYILAGMALAEAAGTPDYEALLQRRILEPLGMDHTGFDRLDLLLEKRAYPYDYSNGVPHPITRFRNLAPLGPAGAMYSTLGDLERWAHAVFYSDMLISPEIRRRYLPSDPGAAHGLVRQRLGVGEDQKVEVVHHTGQIAGTFAWIAYFPARNVHVILLSNIGFTLPQNELMSAIAGVLDGIEPGVVAP